jgi:hypothetical protein
MRGMALLLMMTMASGAAWADHTKEDAQATTRKLEAILHPPKKAKPKPAPKPQPPVVVATTTEAPTRETHASAAKPVVDPLYAIIVHAMSIPFDEKEREAHLRDIPKNAKELDAHLRRLDAALEAQHHHR